MSNNTVSVNFTANTASAVAAIERFGKSIAGLGESVKLGLGIDLAGRFVNKLLEIPNAIESAIDRGIEFNSTLEDARLGIAAVLKQFNPDKFEDFNDALAESDKAIASLKKQAAESPATFQNLVGAFQALTGPMTGARVQLQKQLELIVLMSQALPALGIRSEQLIQESRALVTGNINQDAAAAKILGITAEQVNQAKAAGKLYEFLTEKLSAFGEAGKIAATSYSTSLSNLTDAFEQTAAAASKPIFETLKQGFVDVTKEINKPDVQNGVKSLIETINLGVQIAFKLGQAGVKNAGLISEAFQGVAFTVAGAAAAFTAFKASALLTSPLTAYGVILWGVVKAIQAGVEAWKMWKAQKQEALSLKGLVDENRGLSIAVRNLIDDQERAGLISAERAKRTRETLALLPKLNPQFANDYLTSTSRYLLGVRPGSERQPFGADVIGAENLPGANKEGMKAAMLAELDEQEAALKSSFERRQMSVREYYAKREELIRARTNIEARLGEQSSERVRELEAKENVDIEKLHDEHLQTQLERNKEAADLEIEIAEQKGDRLLAAQLRIQQKYNELRFQQPDRFDELNHLEAMELAQARITSELERQSKAEADYQQKVQTTQALLDSAQISAGEAREHNNRAARDYLAILQATLTELQTMAALNPELKDVAEKVAAIKVKIEETKTAIKETGFFATWHSEMNRLQDEWLDFGKNVAQTTLDAMRASVQGVTNAIMDAAAGTQSWGRTFAQVGRQIIGNLISITTEYIASKLAMMAVDFVFHKKSQQQAAQTTAVSGAAGVAKAGEQGGWVGVLIYLGVFAAAIAAIAGIAAGLTGGFSEGGYTGPGGKYEIAGNVHKDEFVMPSEKSWIFPLLEKVRTGAITARDLYGGVSGALARPITSEANAGERLPGLSGGGSGGSGDVHVAPAPVHIYPLYSEQQVLRVMESNSGRAIIYDEMTKRRIDTGQQT